MDFCNNSLMETLLHRLQSQNSYANYNGIELISGGEEGVVGTMPVGPDKLNPNDTVHGGAIFTLADTVSGTAAIACGLLRTGLDVEQLSCTTVDASIHYLRAARGSKLTCRATPRKVGGTLAVVDVSILDDQGVETCSGTFTFMFVDRTRFVK